MAVTLFAAFPDAEMAQRAAGALLDHGVRTEDLSLLTDYKAAKGAPVGVPLPNETYDREVAVRTGLTTTTPADAAVGAAKGAGVGLGVGVLAGLAMLVIPGFGLVLGGGALAAAMTAAAATTAAGALAGSVAGYLQDQGVPEQAAQQYESALAHGGAVLSVVVPSGTLDVASAEALAAKYGANDVNLFTTADSTTAVDGLA